MFTAVAQKNKAVAKAYFSEHLSHNDYYSQGEVQAGRWIGLGGERLGLIEGQAVDEGAFMRLCENADPFNGKLLTQRLNCERRVFFDFTCSAPKSVSIMAVTMGDERITQAHQIAARMAVKELEQFAAARVRKGGSDSDRTTGNFVGAEFLHNSSRALDPQLHTHFALFNATFDASEQRWKALQTGEMFGAIHYATEVYRNELAKRLHALGYETERTADAFEIKGVPQALCARFSKRSRERDRVVAEMEERLGRKVSKDEIAHAVHKTRSRKLKGITTDEVRQRQLGQMSLEEVADLRSLKQQANGFDKGGGSLRTVHAEEAIQYAVEHVFERNSVVPLETILQHALMEGRGCVDLQSLKDKVRSSDAFIRVGREYSTRAILETELYLIERMNAGQNAFAPLKPKGFSLSQKLGPDQRQAIELLLHSPDQFTGMRGLAGTGKSTALTELCRAIRAAGCEPVVCAPTGSATDVLRKDGFNAVTLQKLLVDPSLKMGLGSKSVLILDEAGAVGIDAMKQFFKLAIDSGSRAFMSGDTGQHSSVARGDALRILEEHSRYCFGQLTRIRRQRQDAYREVVELAANKRPLEAFQRLEAMGVVSEGSHIYREAVAAYLSALERRRSALLVAPTWAEIEALTGQVRTALKAAGRIGVREVSHTVYESLSWTNAQKRNPARYQPGQVLLFHQSSGNFKQHQAATVVRAGKTSLQVRLESGPDGQMIVRRFRPQAGTNFDVCEARELRIAPGDKLLLQANRSSDNGGALVNGQLVEVRTIENGRIQLADDRILPANYRRFCHGYAVTSHASQGKTVDEVLLVAGSRSMPAVNQEQFYVSISRGRERCLIFTDDKEMLRHRIARSQERKAALELAELAEAMRKQGYPVRESVAVEQPVREAVRSVRRLCTPARCIELARLFQNFLARVKQSIREAPAVEVSVAPEQQPSIADAVKVEQPAPSVKIEQAAPTIKIEQATPTVKTEQVAPTVKTEQPVQTVEPPKVEPPKVEPSLVEQARKRRSYHPNILPPAQIQKPSRGIRM